MVSPPQTQGSRRSLLARGHAELIGRLRRSSSQAALALLVGLGLGLFVIAAGLLPFKTVALLLFAVMALTAVAVTGQVRRFTLAAVILDIPLQVDVNLFYHDALAALGAIGGLSISLSLIGLAVLYALWLAEWLAGDQSGQRTPTRPWGRWSRWPVVYVVLVWFSLLLAQNVLLGSFEAIMLTQMLLLFIYVVAHTRTRQDVLFLAGLLMLSLVIEGALMVLVMVLGRGVDFSIAYADFDKGRAGGTLGSPIVSAGFLYLLLAPALSLLLSRVNRRLRLLALAAFALGGLGLIFTFSRGGWLAFLISCGLVVLLSSWRGWLPWQVALVTAAILFALGFFFQDAILFRLFGDDGGSAASRLPLMELALQMIRDNPLGVGSNNFAVRLHDYALVDRAGVWLYTVHNKYLLIWAETGLAALLAYLAFLGVTLHRAWRSWHSQDRMLAPLALALGAAILGNMVHMMVDIFNSRGVVELLWLNAGLITAVFCILREEGLLPAEGTR